VNTVE